MKLFFVDTETTGLNAFHNGIHQISAIVEIDGEVAETLDIYVKPFEKDRIETAALRVSDTTKEDLESYPPPSKVYQYLISVLDKYIDKYDKTDKFLMVGYNVRFDDEFLRAWFKKNGDNYYGSYYMWPAFDVANVAALLLLDQRKNMKDFKLMTVAEKLGIEINPDNVHNATYDIEITRKMYQTVVKLLKGK